MAAQLNLNTDKIEKIKTQVQSINDTANAQATTISEIAALLEGKSVPGGGGGASIDTCTVILDIQNADVYSCSSTIYTNGEIQANNESYTSNGINSTQVTIDNVVCGSSMCILATGWHASLAITIDGAATVDFYNEVLVNIYGATLTLGKAAGSTITITIWDND